MRPRIPFRTLSPLIAVVALSACETPAPVSPPLGQPADAPLCVPTLDSFVDRVSDPGSPDSPGDSVTHADLDDDGIPDVILGAPNATVSGESSAGAVYVCWGAEGGGIDIPPNQENDCTRFTSPGGAESVAEFGAALAVLNETDQGGVWLVVGAPGADTTTEDAGRERSPPARGEVAA